MKKQQKSYPVTAFKLWKHDPVRGWYHYNQVFDSSDMTTYGYMSACKMMSHGWIPYGLAMIPGKHEPLQLEIVDYAPLDEMIKESDPIGVIAGDAIREFLQKTPVDGRRKNSLGAPKQVLNRVIAIAQDAQQNGQCIPKHLLKLLGDNNV